MAMLLLNVCVFLPVAVAVRVAQEKLIKRLPHSHQVILNRIRKKNVKDQKNKHFVFIYCD